MSWLNYILKIHFRNESIVLGSGLKVASVELVDLSQMLKRHGLAD